MHKLYRNCWCDAGYIRLMCVYKLYGIIYGSILIFLTHAYTEIIHNENYWEHHKLLCYLGGSYLGGALFPVDFGLPLGFFWGDGVMQKSSSSFSAPRKESLSASFAIDWKKELQSSSKNWSSTCPTGSALSFSSSTLTCTSSNWKLTLYSSAFSISRNLNDFN